jgi:hypothetical protein
MRDIIEELPNQTSEEDCASLTIHSCFIAALHLANENNLFLKQNGECNFAIQREFDLKELDSNV